MVSRTSLILGLALTSSLGHAQFSGAVPPPADLKTGFDSISESYVKNILKFLSGPECEGRGSGQPGFQKAADFVAARFKEFGLKPMGDNGTYFQNVEFGKSGMAPGSFELRVAGVRTNAGLFPSITDDVAFDAPAVLIEVSKDATDLPDGTDLNGKIAILRGPERNVKLESAASVAGAVAVLSVVDKLPKLVQRARPMRTPGSMRRAMSIAPKGMITAQTMDALLRAKLFEQSHGPSQAMRTSTMNIHIGAKFSEQKVMVPNVVAALEGSDPMLKDQWVGLGGHLDHLGIQNGVVYPGADDDGSGSTSVIAIARAISKNPTKPRRGILFMTFCGEELGLIGSGYLSEHPPVPLDKMVSEFQMDMVGRDSYGPQNGDLKRIDVESENKDTIRLVGSKRISTELDQIIQDMNKYVNFRFKYDAEDVYTRSDHYNFARKGVPIAFLFDGFTPSYHQPTDIWDTMDFFKLMNSAKLYYLCVNAVANRTEPPKKDVPQGGGR